MQTGGFKTSWNAPGAIRISRGPYRVKGKGGQPTYRDLWPPKWLFDGYIAEKVSESEYIVAYGCQLAALSPRKVYDDLVALGGVDAVLLCHCLPGAFCHRRLVAEWLEAKLGISVPEIS